MSSNRKTFALILTLIITMSCLTLLSDKPVNAQTTPKPSAPEFTVKFAYAEHLYENNKTYRTIEFLIKNQPIDRNLLLFDIRVKKANTTDNWQVFREFSAANYMGSNQTEYDMLLALNLTKIVFAEGSPGIFYYPQKNYMHFDSGDLRVQIKAVVAKYVFPAPDNPYAGYYDIKAESDWSNTQTITVPERTTASPSPTAPIPTINTGPHMPEAEPFPTIPVAAAIAIIGIGLLVYYKKRQRSKNL
ncbi:hypothetical protein GX563_08640 [Candidatus Bathyarchaeota archaeon]|nr:hypothetical protein [Candidatus Bathyarchaeota archaeon]